MVVCSAAMRRLAAFNAIRATLDPGPAGRLVVAGVGGPRARAQVGLGDTSRQRLVDHGHACTGYPGALASRCCAPMSGAAVAPRQAQSLLEKLVDSRPGKAAVDRI